MLFRKDSEFRIRKKKDQEIKELLHILPTGGVSRFMTALTEEISKDPGGYEITLIGHSMGTIVANHLLREFPELLRGQLFSPQPAVR